MKPPLRLGKLALALSLGAAPPRSSRAGLSRTSISASSGRTRGGHILAPCGSYGAEPSLDRYSSSGVDQVTQRLKSVW